MKQKLTSDTFLLYATKMYSNPSCSGIEEFYEDLSRVKYIKRLLIRFKNGGKLRERLILNHIITLQNIFGAEACTRILFHKINPSLHSMVVSFLQYLQYLPESIPEVELIIIASDHRIDKILKNLK